MSRRYYSNNAPQQQLSSNITSTQTTLAVSGSFSGWPSSFPYFAAIELGTANMEIVSVTNVVGTTATIVRGQDGTSGVTHAAGATIDQVIVRQDMDEANSHVNSTSGVHGVTGNLVGDSDAQTLTNKTLDSPTTTGTATLSGTENVTGTIDVTGGTAKGFVPSGCILPSLSIAAPAGWLLCIGQTVSRVTYPDLLGAITWTFTANVTSGSQILGSPSAELTARAFEGLKVEGSGVPAGTTLHFDAINGWELSANATGTHAGTTLTVFPYGNGDGSTTFALPDLRSKFLMGGNGFNTKLDATPRGSSTHTHALSDAGQAQITMGTSTLLRGRFVSASSWTATEQMQTTANASTPTATQGAALTGSTDSGSTLPPYVEVSYIIKT